MVTCYHSTLNNTSSGNMVRQDNTHDYSVGKLHRLSKRADCRSKYSKRQITCTCMENTAESYCAETNLKGYFLKWFPVQLCRFRLRTMRKNENCACKAQDANTKFACRKSAMKQFVLHFRTTCLKHSALLNSSRSQQPLALARK